MFEERDTSAFAKQDSKGKTPYITNLHVGRNASPYEWIVDNGKSREGNMKQFNIRNIKFFFCVKHDNSGKIESHMWFFKGFCAYTNPKYCQMIDAGTIPMRDSISQVVKYMEVYDRIGGASGEIVVFEPSDKELGYGYHRVNDPKKINQLEEKRGNKTIIDGCYMTGDGKWYERTRRNVLQRFEARCMILAQYVEYKISHYLDKSFESLFGFISVLPGAFCTFRWAAISGDPLKSFFKGLEKDKHTAKEANMYLAEDRVM